MKASCFVVLILLIGSNIAIVSAEMLPPIDAPLVLKAPKEMSENGKLALKRAKDLIANKKYSRAISELENALQKENNGHLHWFLGKALLEAGNRRKAYLSYKTAWQSPELRMDTFRRHLLPPLANLTFEFGTSLESDNLFSSMKHYFPETVWGYNLQCTFSDMCRGFEKGSYSKAFLSYDSKGSHLVLSPKDCSTARLKKLAHEYKKAKPSERDFVLLTQIHKIKPSKKLREMIISFWNNNKSYVQSAPLLKEIKTLVRKDRESKDLGILLYVTQ